MTVVARAVCTEPVMALIPPNPDVRRLVAPLREALPDLMAVYLFGSAASGHAGRESDLDLAALTEKPMPARQRFNLAETLARIAGRDVDLVDLRSADTVLRMQVVERGRRLFARSWLEAEEFENFVYRDYADLNERRAGILSDIRERGAVHDR